MDCKGYLCSINIYFLHVVGEKNASIGYSSSLPSSIIIASSIFTGIENMAKQPLGPICPIPGPMFEIHARGAVKFVAIS